MTSILPAPPKTRTDASNAPVRPIWGLLRDLEHPSHMFRSLGPNWYASVMGTGIVANAAATLPVQVSGLRAGATVVWALAAALLVALTAAWGVHWTRHPAQARAHAENPVMAQFWGAPAMALLTVGAGTLTLGRDWLGLPTALTVDVVLWVGGTLLGLVASAWIPYKMMTSHRVAPDAAFGGWLMPVVPPMVSAAAGALLVPYAPAGQVRLDPGARLLRHVRRQPLRRRDHRRSGLAAARPPRDRPRRDGAHALDRPRPAGAVGDRRQPARQLRGARAARALRHGRPSLRAPLRPARLGVRHDVAGARCRGHGPHRAGPPAVFADLVELHFPVGTVATGTSGLALRTESVPLRWAAAACYAMLVVAWLTVAARTAWKSARGRIFFRRRPSLRPGHRRAAGRPTRWPIGRQAYGVRKPFGRSRPLGDPDVSDPAV